MRHIRLGILGFLVLAIAWTVLSSSVMAADIAFAEARNRLVDQVLAPSGIQNGRVLDAIRSTPRHEFVPLASRHLSYYDMALPIGNRQTISPPFVVAYMTEKLDPQPTDRVLEIGTGSGYQAAVLSPLVESVYTIEIVESLGRKAAKVLKKLKYANVHPKIGDGYLGWPEAAEFDKIIVTCSPEKVPVPLVEQLREGGRMIIPVGQRYQQTLYLFTKKDGQLVPEKLESTLFVPMTGEAEAGRVVLPDPSRPTVANGDFEETLQENRKAAQAEEETAAGTKSKPSSPVPAGWHYQRQLTLVDDAEAPSGERFARFINSQPGRMAQALQGFAVDGRQVGRLQVSIMLRGKGLYRGLDSTQQPFLGITFYNKKRAPIGQWILGPWLGDFGWRNETSLVPVPIQAREAILRIGLFGGVGQLDVDELELRRAD